jgi:hypothetical protein
MHGLHFARGPLKVKRNVGHDSCSVSVAFLMCTDGSSLNRTWRYYSTNTIDFQDETKLFFFCRRMLCKAIQELFAFSRQAFVSFAFAICAMGKMRFAKHGFAPVAIKKAGGKCLLLFCERATKRCVNVGKSD